MYTLALPTRLRSRNLTHRLLIVAATLCFALYMLRPSSPEGYGIQFQGDSHLGYADSSCGSGLDVFDRVVIVVKTGATEAIEKLPTQLVTALRCVPARNMLHFSDMAQTIGEIEVHDALDAVPAQAMAENPDFDIYRKQQELKDPALIVSTLKTMRSPTDAGSYAAWTLDKYKNIYILEKSWAMRPDRDWYMYIDADTYILWPSLIEWLKRLDSSRANYFGSLACIGRSFAHGGSGYILSKPAVTKLTVAQNGTAERWHYEIADPMHCCGDFMLAEALREVDISIKNSLPTINGETPSTIPFKQDTWCQPIVTMHHVKNSEFVAIKEFEQKRPNPNAPVTFADIFTGITWDLIPDHPLEDWYNLSDWEGTSLSDIPSAAACIQACAEKEDCLQSLWKAKQCMLSTVTIAFGQKYNRMPDEDELQSSWNKTRIADWVSKQGPCGEVKFPYEDGKNAPGAGYYCPEEVEENQ